VKRQRNLSWSSREWKDTSDRCASCGWWVFGQNRFRGQVVSLETTQNSGKTGRANSKDHLHEFRDNFKKQGGVGRWEGARTSSKLEQKLH